MPQIPESSLSLVFLIQLNDLENHPGILESIGCGF